MIVVIDVGATKTQISFSFTGEEFEDTISIETPQNQRKVIEEITTQVRGLIGNRQIDLVAICVPGAINFSRGTITHMHHLPWKNLQITKPLSKLLLAPVILAHDASAAAIAESRIGSGKDYSLCVYCTLSTGIGSAITQNGNLLSSPHNQEGGDQIIDKGHIHSQTRGKLCNYASGSALAKRFNINSTKTKYSSSEWELFSYEIAIGIYNIIQIVAPEVVILGGGISNHFDSFIKPLRSNIDSFKPLYPTPPIKQARFINDAPSQGMLLLANEYLS